MIQEYLVKEHEFRPLKLARPLEPSPPRPSQHDSKNASTSTTPRTAPTTFQAVEELLEYATQHWQQNFVTTSIHSAQVAEVLSRRPFFILIHVDAPLTIRYQRYQASTQQQKGIINGSSPPDGGLASFLERSEAHYYSPHTRLSTLASRAQIQILNSGTSLDHFKSSLARLNLTDPARLRPTWDQYFMHLASLAARRSNCMRRQVGCVLVRQNRVLSTGYNGTPRNLLNCTAGGCPRCNNSATNAGGTSLSTCLCLHAEENALLEAGRERVGGEAVLYCNTCPCLTCSIKIVQVGIAEVVFSQSYYMDAEAAKIFEEAGVRLRQFSPPREGLVELGGDMQAEINGGTSI